MKGVTKEHIQNRLDKFIGYYASSGNAYQSAIKAGYSEQYAKAGGRLLVATAEKRLAEIKADKITPQKKTMAELVGFSKKELMDNIKFLGEQERDLSVRLKVVAPLAKEYGVDLNPTENSITVPILNMNVNTEPRNTAKPQRIIEDKS